MYGWNEMLRKVVMDSSLFGEVRHQTDNRVEETGGTDGMTHSE